MDLGFDGRVALVTASSKGIGRAIAMGLAAEGAHVSLCARGQATLESTAGDIRANTGAQVLATVADLSRPADIQRVVQATLERFGRIDILICNAGGPPPGGFLDLPDDVPWEQAYQANLMSVVRLCRLVIPSMRERRWGRIITITSKSVKEPIPTLVLSNVMRAGVTALVKSLSTEVGPYGILVNSVLPGSVLTDRYRSLAHYEAQDAGQTTEEIIKRAAHRIPVGRIATPEEFAAVVVFLASERASYMNGASISVDGGEIKSLM